MTAASAETLAVTSETTISPIAEAPEHPPAVQPVVSSLLEAVEVVEEETDRLGPVEAVSLGLKSMILSVTLLTFVGVMVLGPFGFLPALLLAPLVLMFLTVELVAWVCGPGEVDPSVQTEERSYAMIPEPKRVEAPQPKPRKLMTKTRPASPKNVAKVHLTLPGLLEALEEEHNLFALMKQLRELRLGLAEHFEDEEAPGGLFEELRRMDPSVDPSVCILEREHSEILAEIDETVQRFGTFRTKLQTGKHGRIRKIKKRVVERIGSHQCAEDRLIQEVYGFKIEGELNSY